MKIIMIIIITVIMIMIMIMIMIIIIMIITVIICLHFQAVVFQVGKVNITDTSQNNHGCQTVSFNTQFQGSGDDIKVFATLSHSNKYVAIHDPASLWVESAQKQVSKPACARQGVALVARL